MLEVLESDFSKNRSGHSTTVNAAAGERSGVGLLEVTESDFPSLSNSAKSCLVLSSSACARLSRAARAVATSYSLGSGRQGPTGRRSTKGGVSGPAEDLLPVSEVEAGVNSWPAGGVRGQVAGSLPGRQPGTGTRKVRGGAVTPSLHPEVPDTQFVSPGRGVGIRQPMGWMKVCETAQSGIWVLKGVARARMLPDNLDHLRVERKTRGNKRDCLAYARARLSVSIQVWTWSSSQTTN